MLIQVLAAYLCWFHFLLQQVANGFIHQRVPMRASANGFLPKYLNMGKSGASGLTTGDHAIQVKWGKWAGQVG